jgi:hypothetical protein
VVMGYHNTDSVVLYRIPVYFPRVHNRRHLLINTISYK